MIDAKVISQLLVMQSIAVSLPDEKSIFSFVCRGLLDMPGVTAVRYSDTPQEHEDASTVRIQLLINQAYWGELLFTVKDKKAFAPYVDFLNNFAYVLAVILEERSQRRQKDLLQSQLEARVQERTRQLQDEIVERKKTEEALRESKLQLEMTIRASNTGLWDWDLKTNKVYYSPEWKLQLGYEDHEISNDFSEWETRVHPDDLEQAKKNVSDYIERPYPNFSNEFRMLHKDGSYRWILAQASLLFDEQGNPSRMMGSHIDITARKQADVRLMDALSDAQRFREAMDHIPTYIYMKDTQSRYVYANQPTLELFGCSAKELVGCDDTRFFPPDTVKRLREVDSRVFLGEQTTEEIDVADAKGGRRVYWEIKTPIYTEPDRKTIWGLLGISTDITERKKMDNLLKASLRVSEFALKHSLDELITKTLDEAELLTGSQIGFFHFLDEDQKTIRLQNWSTNTLQKMCTAKGKGQHYSVDQAGVWVDCIHERRPVIHNNYAALPHRKGMPDGHAPVIRELVVPIFRGDNITGIIGVGNKQGEYDEKDIEIVSRLANLVWEIVVTKRTEEALRFSEHNLVEAERIGNTGSWDYDVASDTANWSENMFRIFDVDPMMPKELVFKHFVENLVHPDDREHILSVFRDALNGKRPYDLEYRIIKKDGSVRDIHALAETLQDGYGKVIRMIGKVEDITERKRVEEELKIYRGHLEELVEERTAELNEKTRELKESRNALMSIVEDLNSKSAELEAVNIKLKELDRLKSMFIASMSHELRTPLNSVIGFSSILLKEWEGPLNEEQKNFASIILRSGKHLLALINDVIDVSKIEAGRIESNYEDFDLYDVITETATTLKKDIADKGLELKIDSVHQMMHTDRRRLLQCVLNLLSNATKFTLKGNVRITALADFDYIEISVEDTGIGIREEDMSKLFGAFVRLESPIKTLVLGTGLGLYLTKKLVTEVLKGEIMVESTYEKGSKFTIRIPRKI